jgi:ATP-binding cassette subfamily B protein
VVRAAFCYDIEMPRLARIDRLLAEASVPPERRAQVAKTILREQLGSARVGGGWLLRLSPGVNIWKQARHALLFHPVAILFGAHIVQQLLRVLAWWVIGRGALQGHFDRAWLVAWALILLTAIPFQVLVSWAQSLLAIGAGGLFKQRLLYGTLQLESEEVRHQGAGQFLGRAMESEAVELLALGGGFMAMVAVVEMAIAAWVLSMGSGGWLHALLLLGWVVFTTLIGWHYFRRSQPWIETYRQMTNDLVERMVGHRTRLAQESHRYWHDEEDRVLARYLKLSHGLDRIGMRLGSFITRGWLVLGLAGIAYTFILFPNSATQLAISLGGIILAFQALNSLMMGILSVIEAMLAWKQVAPLFHAAARPTDKPSLDLELTRTARSSTTSAAVAEQRVENNGLPVEAEDEEVVLVARDLAFRYREYGRLVLEDCNLQIQQGDRLLLEGPSGGGKSTLAALLAGLRKPESGLLLLWGLDWQTLGTAEWRRRVVAAPQFHENHVLTETFAFNLLMGRGWPPQAEDLL